MRKIILSVKKLKITKFHLQQKESMRLTFGMLQSMAKTKRFVFERNDRGKGYQLWSNELAPGVVAEYETLQEAYSDIYYLFYKNQNPISSKPLT